MNKILVFVAVASAALGFGVGHTVGFDSANEENTSFLIKHEEIRTGGDAHITITEIDILLSALEYSIEGKSDEPNLLICQLIKLKLRGMDESKVSYLNDGEKEIMNSAAQRVGRLGCEA